MELKQQADRLIKLARELLIVPYGIETKLLSQTLRTNYLLIVPYGIETCSAEKVLT